MSDWISVDDGIPEVGDIVIAYAPDDKYIKHCIEEWVEHHEAPVPSSSKTILIGVGWSEHEFEEITHWMPLPEPPK